MISHVVDEIRGRSQRRDSNGEGDRRAGMLWFDSAGLVWFWLT